MSTSQSRTRPRGVFWVAVPVFCLASAVVGGLFVRGWTSRPATASPTPTNGAPVAVDHARDEIGALRAEVRRLGLLIGAMAAAVPSAAAAPSAEAPTARRPAAPPPDLPTVTRDDAVARYEAAPPNSMKTRTVASSLSELLKKESLAASKVEVDEVNCRGEACRVRVSFAEDAPPQSVVMELASLLPDSHSFQEAAPAGSHRRAVTSLYLDDANAAAR